MIIAMKATSRQQSGTKKGVRTERNCIRNAVEQSSMVECIRMQPTMVTVSLGETVSFSSLGTPEANNGMTLYGNREGGDESS